MKLARDVEVAVLAEFVQGELGGVSDTQQQVLDYCLGYDLVPVDGQPGYTISANRVVSVAGVYFVAAFLDLVAKRWARARQWIDCLSERPDAARWQDLLPALDAYVLASNADCEAALVRLEPALDQEKEAFIQRLMRLNILFRLRKFEQLETEFLQFQKLIEAREETLSGDWLLQQGFLIFARMNELEADSFVAFNYFSKLPHGRRWSARILYRYGGLGLALGQAALVLDDLVLAAKALPNSVAVQTRLARAYMAEDQWDNASEVMDNVPDSRLFANDLLLLRGMCAQKLGRVEEALELFRSILATDADNVEALVGEANCLIDLGEYPGVRMIIRKLSDIAPGEKAITLLMFSLTFKEHDYQRARRFATTLQKREPWNPDFLVLEAKVLAVDGSIKEIDDLIARLSQVKGYSSVVSELREARERLGNTDNISGDARPVMPAKIAPQAAGGEKADFEPIDPHHLVYRRPPSLVSRLGLGLITERIGVINALVFLEIKQRYSRRVIGYAASLVTPFFMLTMIYVLFAFIRHRQPGNMSLELFILSGITVWLSFLFSMTVMVGVCRRQFKLVVHQVVKMVDHKIACLIVEIVPVFIIAFVCCVALFLFDFGIVVTDLPLLLLSLFLTVLFGYSLGMILGVLSTYAEIFLAFQMFIRRILFFLSGIFFSLDELPSGMKEIVQYIPLAHMAEAVRFSLSETYPATSLSMPLAVSTILAIFFLAILFDRLGRKSMNG